MARRAFCLAMATLMRKLRHVHAGWNHFGIIVAQGGPSGQGVRRRRSSRGVSRWGQLRKGRGEKAGGRIACGSPHGCAQALNSYRSFVTSYFWLICVKHPCVLRGLQTPPFCKSPVHGYSKIGKLAGVIFPRKKKQALHQYPH